MLISGLDGINGDGHSRVVGSVHGGDRGSEGGSRAGVDDDGDPGLLVQNRAGDVRRALREPSGRDGGPGYSASGARGVGGGGLYGAAHGAPVEIDDPAVEGVDVVPDLPRGPCARVRADRCARRGTHPSKWREWRGSRAR